ncbi:hypothetical protein TDB9533_02418 [Thalassocella blandensis]|nr:hypothetical protein TDB9533_02418 [Thalassocella blandensis]
MATNKNTPESIETPNTAKDTTAASSESNVPALPQVNADTFAPAIQNALPKDAFALKKIQQQILQRQQKGLPFDRKFNEFFKLAQSSQERLELRRSQVPAITIPQELPISEKQEEICRALENNQVLILAGETGSGKTTQIPKMCLQMGRGINGLIGHTQPRRIAASTVASRIADELQCELGTHVGYQVRFTDHTAEQTYIKLMTDGILLAEIQHDPLLLKYDTLIIDEAHERTLNIDFLLGYIKQLLEKRPDLKLIVTSATIDVERFSRHFNRAPIIEVSGRTYPVEVRYRPWIDAHEDVNEAIVDCIAEILESSKGAGGDILIFLSGERDIREASHAIKKAGFSHLEILPLYARLSLAEQSRVFHGHKGRRVVLATNVAETSLTVPGIKYVIDTGVARISRYSLRHKVQRLPIEAISRASADQRKGRCGRVSEGICYRLYEEEDFLARPEFTDAEILRTNLAAVVLQMLQMNIGDIREFPFVDAPDNRLINDGFKLLEEVKAVSKKGRVTQIGNLIHQLPLDPRLARAVVEANKLACLHEVLIIAAALSIQDPRERPVEKQQAADMLHRRFWDESSDFSAYLNLWRYLEEKRQELSQSQFRKLCKNECINYLRVREWRDLHHQLKLSIKNLKYKENVEPSNYEAIHQAILSGFLSNVGLKSIEQNTKEYDGTRNRKFLIFPGSSQHKKRPKWMVAAEFIETSQLFAHNIARIEPGWVLDQAEHLVKKHYFEPHYDLKTGQVKAFVRITLFGLTLVEKKRVQYNKIDEREANDVFIREALVEGKYRGEGKFYLHNQALIAEVEDLEAKTRRRDIMVDEQVIIDFYKSLIPQNISNLTGFEHWRKQFEATHPDGLKLSREQLMLHSASDASEAQFPNQLRLGDYIVPVSYGFEPGKENDGVSIHVPVEVLHHIPQNQLEWLVPGLLKEKCAALVKSLPKRIRKHFVPVPQTIDRIFPRLKYAKQTLTEALAEQLAILVNCEILPEDWEFDLVEKFYFMNIVVVDERGKVIDASRDLDKLKQTYRQKVQNTIAQVGNELEQSEIKRWDFGGLPKSVELDKAGIKIKAYPALIDSGQHVDLKILDSARDAKFENLKGITRLAVLECHTTCKYLAKNLFKGKDLGMAVVDMGKKDQIIDDVILAAVYEAMFAAHYDSGGEINSESEFETLVNAGKSDIVPIAERFERHLTEALSEVVQIRKSMKASKNALALAFAFSDIKTQLDNIYFPGCIFATPLSWVEQWPRYMKAIRVRMEKAPQNPKKDKLQLDELASLWQMHEERLAKEGEAAYRFNTEWVTYRWMLEEMRVSAFAQTLKTLMPVSEKRLKKIWQEL